ncbi:hypothetical protein HAX54_044233 [Datura stramonium]|uniref:Uncharacterized protein n=1 Tax=Datura stramonium TaxID=4076 RepID=A0ABS8SP78_DATST|nr:hypothetical protein [Datura stramonium]
MGAVGGGRQGLRGGKGPKYLRALIQSIAAFFLANEDGVGVAGAGRGGVCWGEGVAEHYTTSSTILGIKTVEKQKLLHNMKRGSSSRPHKTTILRIAGRRSRIRWRLFRCRNIALGIIGDFGGAATCFSYKMETQKEPHQTKLAHNFYNSKVLGLDVSAEAIT